MNSAIRLYMIYDTRAQMLIGGIQPFKHDAPAIRFFDDVARGDNSIVGKHPHDFQLLCIGELEEDGTLCPNRRIVLEGSVWFDTVNAQSQGSPS